MSRVITARDQTFRARTARSQSPARRVGSEVTGPASRAAAVASAGRELVGGSGLGGRGGTRVLSGGPRGVHHIDGVGDGPPGPLFRLDLVDDIEAVTDDEVYAMARALARREGILGGKSSAANVVAALRAARRLDPGRVVVTVLCDSGYKYLQGDLYR